MEIKTNYNSTIFDVICRTGRKNSIEEMMIEFYLDDEDVEVDIPKLKISLKKYIRLVNDYTITRNKGLLIIIINFRPKVNPIDFVFDFSLN